MTEKSLWTIGYRGEENGPIQQMSVRVDEVSPKEHYLYLYDVETREQEVKDDEDVVELKEVEIAKVVGFFSPAVWIFAVNESADPVILFNDPSAKSAQ